MIKKELWIFFTAMMFFTRLPCPKRAVHDDTYMDECSKYFPLIGIIVGGVGGGVFYGCSFIFPFPLAVLLSMISTILVTGAFHEDGLADACDGFGGGWTRETILMIMKDSRLGTFGVVGLLCVLSVKYCCLTQMPPQIIPLVLIASHSLSRFAASTLLFNLKYVRDDVDSKAKPAIKKMSAKSLAIGLFWGMLPLLLFRNMLVFLVLLPVACLTFFLSRYFLKWIGGHTGDCGGATQQLCELIIYLSFVVLWKFI